MNYSCPHCGEGCYSCHDDVSYDLWNGDAAEVRCTGCGEYYIHAPHMTKEEAKEYTKRVSREPSYGSGREDFYADI